MASPQCEDGYTKIANELLEALCKTRIPGEIRQVLDAVIRLTYGWNLKKHPISYREFSNITGLQYGHIYRAIKSLIEHNFIVRDKMVISCKKIMSFGYPTPKMDYPILEYPKVEYLLLQKWSIFLLQYWSIKQAKNLELMVIFRELKKYIKTNTNIHTQCV